MLLVVVVIGGGGGGGGGGDVITFFSFALQQGGAMPKIERTREVTVTVPGRMLAHANILPCTGHENNIAQPKAVKCPGSTSHFSPFNCCLSVVL